MLAKNWPDKYSIEIDSSPYYGEGDGYFHPSTHAVDTPYANTGARFLYYLYHPEYRDRLVPEKRSIQSEMALAMGSAIHGIIQTQLEMMGMVTEEDIEVEFRNEEHMVRGKLDLRVHHPNRETFPVEIKTQNIYSYPKQKTLKEEWDIQMSLEEDNLGFSWGVLLLVEAGWPYNLRELRHTRNDVLLSTTYQKFDYVRERIAFNRPPKHCCSFGSTTMKSCPARYVCWLAEEKP